MRLKHGRKEIADMRIVFVGAGNLATNLCKAVKAAGHDVLQVYSRTMKSAMELAEIAGASYTDSLDDVVDSADIYIVAVKDNVVAEVSETLRKRVGEKLIVHTAGSMPMSLIPGESRGVFYPMQTFSKHKDVDFSCIPCFIEAQQGKDCAVLKELAQSVSDSVYEMTSEDRKYLHIAAVFCCNFANRCYSIGAELLEKHGGVPFEVMLPLIGETAKKLGSMSPQEAQTGPAVRWDTAVLEKHMAMLSESPLTQEIYDLMSKSIHNGKL